MSLKVFNLDEHKELHREWKDSIPPMTPIIDEDLCLGWGITLERSIATYNKINAIIREYRNDYIWVREYGILPCIHYTKATYYDILYNGLHGSQMDNTTFSSGIYVFNSNQHVPDKSLNYILFLYIGEYYKCVYDPDPYGETSKDIGITQEYLLPVLNLPSEYLDLTNVSDNSTNLFNT